jgi:predicted DsbA family dithiol-disulfide isomerase
MNEDVIKIDVYSDVICPWCYVGKRRLERALDEAGQAVEVQVAWRPFQLNPTIPAAGVDRMTYLEAKFGSLDAFRRLEDQVLVAGASEQIAFAFDKMTKTPNTFLAHRLIWFAAQEGRQEHVVESLFRGYFEEGMDIGSAFTLVQLAERAGLSGDAVDRFLASQLGISEVKAEEAQGHQLGIRGVPYFVFNETYGISGAQPVTVLLSAMDKARGQGSPATQRS